MNNLRRIWSAVYSGLSAGMRDPFAAPRWTWKLFARQLGPAAIERIVGIVMFVALAVVGIALVWAVLSVLFFVRRLFVPALLLGLLVGGASACEQESGQVELDSGVAAGPFRGAGVRVVLDDAGEPALDGGGVPVCLGSPAIVEDCGTRGWHCEVPPADVRVPCVVPALSRLFVASCDLCQAVRP
jgi:hypothetical protein